MMYVWIPRYTYTIFNGNNGTASVQQINIKFESGTNSSGTVSCVDNLSGSYSETCSDSTNGSIKNGTSTYTHPAFMFGTQKLTGFWVGKFESSTTTSTCLSSASDTNCNNANHTIEIKPNADSLRYINVSNAFTSALNVKTKYSITNTDSHMMKNMEWGAVAYLTNSKYGRCTNGTCEEVTINNVRKNTTTYTTQTGCAGSSVSASSVTSCNNTYATTGGVKASITGNVYGIYDMSGGAYEYVMGNMADSSGKFYASSSGFTSAPDSKYYDIYKYDSSSNTTHGRGKLGDATKETLVTFGSYTGGWNSDYAYFPYSTSSWFHRGGYATNATIAGVFYFSYRTGTTNNRISFRVVLVSA